MVPFLFLFAVFFLGIGTAYAEPLDEIQTSIIDHDDNFATIQIMWNYDESVLTYEIGCVSCIPNLAKNSNDQSIIFDNVAIIPNLSKALLYVMAYDSDMEIITAKQVIVDLNGK